MPKFTFEVQNCVEIEVEAENEEEARMKLIDSDDLYYEELLTDVYISNAKKRNPITEQIKESVALEPKEEVSNE